MDPYHAAADHRLKLSTQLAEVVVVLCAMLLAEVKGTTADIACTIIIMVTLLPMLTVLVLYVYDPSGSLLIRLSRQVSFRRAANEAVDDALQFVRELGKAHPEVAEALELTMGEADESQDTASIVEIAAELGRSMLALDTASMRAYLDELLSALGLPQEDIDEILEVLSASKLLAWCLRPKLEPYLAEKGLEWADVVQVLESIDSIEELRAAADDPKALLEGYFPLEAEEKRNEGLHCHRKTGGDGAGRQLVLPASGGDANSLPANKDSSADGLMSVDMRTCPDLEAMMFDV
jgi:hypothetical protein